MATPLEVCREELRATRNRLENCRETVEDRNRQIDRLRLRIESQWPTDDFGAWNRAAQIIEGEVLDGS